MVKKRTQCARIAATLCSVYCLVHACVLSLVSRSPRILVVVVGSLRGGEQLWRTLDNNLLQPLNADLALFTPPHPSTSLHKIAKYVWELPDPSELEVEFDRINPEKSWRDLCAMKLHAFQGLKCGPFEGEMGTAALQFYSREKLREKILDTQVLLLYDWFVITRSDYFYLCRFDAKFGNSALIYTPATQEYKGINDRFVIVHQSKVIRFLNVTQELLNGDPATTASELGEFHAQGNPESVLKLHARHMGVEVKRIPHPGFTLRRSCDVSTWSKGVKGPYGYFIKYQEEMEFAEKVCGKT